MIEVPTQLGSNIDQTTRHNSLELPWARRSTEEWKKYVSPYEAGSLFFLLEKRGGVNFEDPTNFSRWGLNNAFDAYWNNDIERLKEATIQADYDRTSTEFIQRKASVLSDSGINCFSDPKMSTFMLVARYLDKNREGNNNLYKNIAETIDLSQFELEILRSNYQSLVELFLPISRVYAKTASQKFNESFEDWIGIAGLYLSSTTLHFYWETAVIDPNWTTRKFLATFTKPFKRHPDSNNFDTHRLEIQTEIGTPSTTSPYNRTEQDAIERISHSQLIALIDEQTKTAEEAEIIKLRLFYGCSWEEIAKIKGKTHDQITSIAGEFRQTLVNLPKEVKEQFQIPDKAKITRQGEFWENPKEYKDLFEKRKMILTPGLREILNAFFLLNTGDRESTIKAVHTIFPNSTVDNIRHQISKAMLQIMHRRPQEKLGKNDKNWKRHQDTLAVKKLAESKQWDAFSEKEQELMKLYYLEDPTETITGSQVAKKLGLNEGTVSRKLDAIRIKRIKIFDPS